MNNRQLSLLLVAAGVFLVLMGIDILSRPGAPEMTAGERHAYMYAFVKERGFDSIEAYLERINTQQSEIQMFCNDKYEEGDGLGDDCVGIQDDYTQSDYEEYKYYE